MTPPNSANFKSGGKVELKLGDLVHEADYTVEGDKVTIKYGGDITVLTIKDDGSLDGGGILGILKKNFERQQICESCLTSKSRTEPFNTAVRDGTAGMKLKRILDAIKPEAAYFTEQHGTRAVIICDLADPSKIPALAEPWFLTFNADVEFKSVMLPADLEKAGLDKLGKEWAK